MALYFISYDLRKKRDYQKLYDELSRFKAVRVLESAWCFNRTNTDAAGLRDHFRYFIDSDDGLLLSESKDWATWSSDGTLKDLYLNFIWQYLEIALQNHSRAAVCKTPQLG